MFAVVRSLKWRSFLLLDIFFESCSGPSQWPYQQDPVYTQLFLLGLQCNRQALDNHTDLFPIGIPTIDEVPYGLMYKPKNQGYNPGRTLGRKCGIRGHRGLSVSLRPFYLPREFPYILQQTPNQLLIPFLKWYGNCNLSHLILPTS